MNILIFRIVLQNITRTIQSNRLFWITYVVHVYAVTYRYERESVSYCHPIKDGVPELILKNELYELLLRGWVAFWQVFLIYNWIYHSVAFHWLFIAVENCPIDGKSKIISLFFDAACNDHML